MMTKYYIFRRYKYISLKIIFFDKNKKDIDLNVMEINKFKTPFFNLPYSRTGYSNSVGSHKSQCTLLNYTLKCFFIYTLILDSDNFT